MKRVFTYALVLFAGLAVGQPGLAFKQIKTGKGRPPLVLASNMGYVVARIGPTFDVKGAGETIVLFRIDPATGRLRTAEKHSLNPLPKGEDVSALIGGNNAFGTVNGEHGDFGVFVTSLSPGDYVVAGTQSTCYCMGSYRFTVKAGELTDIGTLLVGLPSPNSVVPEFRGPAPSEDLEQKSYTVPEAMAIRAAGEDAVVPAVLQSYRRARAVLTYTRFDNVGGWMINRLSGLPPVDHETADAAEKVADRRYKRGSLSNRWPDVNPLPSTSAAADTKKQ